MAICHGRGDPAGDLFLGGCCYVDGAVCPLRWYIDYSTSDPPGDVQSATILDADRTSLGTVYDYVDNLMPGGGPNKAARMQRVFDQVQGTRYVCSVVAYLLGMDPSLINDRAQLEAQWAADDAYQPIADHWESIGRPRDWCPQYGPTEGQCCFAEDTATNDANKAFLTVDAVTVRSQATGAS